MEDHYLDLMSKPRPLSLLIGDQYLDDDEKSDNVNNVHIQSMKDAHNVHIQDKKNAHNVHTQPKAHYIQQVDKENIHEVPYGELLPTGYKSDLSDVDWMIHYLGYTWKRNYQERICKEIDDRWTVLVKLGRDHGKTWIMMGKFTRYIIEQAPKRCIVIASQAKYREIYEFVDAALERPEIRRDYGDLKAASSIGNGIWFINDLRPKVGANFLIKGSESFITGLHFEGVEDHDYYEDPNDIITSLDDLEEIGWLHLEDIIQELKVGEAAEKRVRRWVKRTVNYIRNHRVKLTGNATSKDPDDIYQMMEHEFGWPIYKIPALKVLSGRLPTQSEVTADRERGLLLDWPRDVGTFETCECPNWPLPRLLYHFVFFRTDAEAELNNNPVNPEGSEFDADDFETSLIDPIEDNVHSFTFIDPSYGSTGSKTAILQIGIWYNSLVVMDAYLGHLGPTEYIDKIMDFRNRWGSLEIWLEDNFRQESRSLSVYNPLSRLPELRTFNTPPGKSKRVRLGLIGGQFRARVWRIYRTLPFLEEIKQEYLTFNSKLDDTTIRTKFNALDTMQMAYEKKKTSLSNRRYSDIVKVQAKTGRSNSRRVFT